MTLPKRLDRSRDSGEYHPPMRHPSVEGAVAHYEQDGFCFDHEGKLVEAFLTPQQKAAADKPPAPGGDAKPKPPKPGNDGDTRVEKRQVAEANKKASGSDQLNLTDWLMGEEVAQEYRVKKVVRDRFKRAFGNLKDLIEFLVVDQHVVSRDQLKAEYRKLIAPQGELVEAEQAVESDED